MACSPFPSMPR
ncbi:hypothetical protein Pint_22736 [Pistacia integerrima]|uniref:Uncharacterized protein n=1 Tax=Pistacia integerrima TaxID=434235 RepID=A0ACC0YI48_9ROSI|nr:hypothetical protein Pint_22736 [Pistacia integerrima]